MSLEVSSDNISYTSNKFQFSINQRLEGSLLDVAAQRTHQLGDVIDGCLLRFDSGEYRAWLVLDLTLEIHQTVCGVQIDAYVPEPQPTALKQATEQLLAWVHRTQHKIK